MKTDASCIAVPLENYPGMNPFVLDWLRGSGPAPQFLRRRGEKNGGGQGSAAESQRRGELVASLIESNRRWGSFVKPQLQRWAAGETLTIVAGQQVGFAGGPLYTFAKIATLLKMKRDLERGGTPVTAFFWLATEDHDFDEVAHLSVPVPASPHRQLDLMSLRTTRAGDDRAAVGPQRIPEPLVAELLALLRIDRPQWLRPGITFGDSFAELISTVFGSELVLVDALLPELRRSGAPLFANIFRSWSAIEQTLADRSADLRQAGYAPQVVPRDGEAYSLLFDLDDRFNRRLISAPRESVEHPEQISTSALTRPLLQDFVLRPDVFVGGPAEVAYYAQIAPLHELLGIDMPRVALRGHALLVPKRSLRFVERFGVKPEELFTPPDALLAEREPEGVEAVKKEAAAGRRQLIERIEAIGELALPADHALARAIARSIGHIEYHFDKLTERAVRGLVRKDRERYAAARELAATLYPDHHVQDRIVAWLPFWLQHEKHLVETVVEAIQPDAPTFEIIGL